MNKEFAMSEEELRNSSLYRDLTATAAAELFEETTYPWEILPRIKEFVKAYGATLSEEEYEKTGDDVWIHRTAKVYPTATVLGPTVIGPETEVRPGAFLRGSILIGRKCVIGNSTEIKNAILFDRVQVPHYNYVGDSILGLKAHTGAGTVCSNFKTDGKNVVVHAQADYETGLRKFGAMLGDGADCGCNAVLCPGTVLGPGTSVYPLTRVRGAISGGCIVKDAETVVRRV